MNTIDMRLRVISKTGKPRERAGFVFTNLPSVVELSKDELYPTDSPECRQRGDWPTPLNSDGSREPCTNRLKQIMDDAGDAGGLFVQEVPDDFVEGQVDQLTEKVVSLTSERDTLAARVAELEAKASAQVAGAKSKAPAKE